MMDATPDIMTVPEVAAFLRVAPKWVYRHKRELGGYQPAPGCAIRFFASKIGEMKDAVLQSDTGALVCIQGDRREAQAKMVPHQRRRQGVGSGAKAWIYAFEFPKNILTFCRMLEYRNKGFDTEK